MLGWKSSPDFRRRTARWLGQESSAGQARCRTRENAARHATGDREDAVPRHWLQSPLPKIGRKRPSLQSRILALRNPTRVMRLNRQSTLCRPIALTSPSRLSRWDRSTQHSRASDDAIDRSPQRCSSKTIACKAAITSASRAIRSMHGLWCAARDSRAIWQARTIGGDAGFSLFQNRHDLLYVVYQDQDRAVLLRSGSRPHRRGGSTGATAGDMEDPSRARRVAA